VEAVPGGLILPEEGKIKEIWVELALNPADLSKIGPGRCPDIGGPHKDNYWAKGAGRSSSQSE